MKKNFKNTDNQTVSISRNELSILTARLFSDNGNNVSPIIEDLTRGGMEKEIAELRTALLYVAPNSDAVTGGPWVSLPRTDWKEGRGSCYLYIFEGYSYLTDKVRYVRVSLDVSSDEHDGLIVKKSWVDYDNTTSLAEWQNRNICTWEQLIPKHLREQYHGLLADYIGSQLTTPTEAEDTWEF